MVDAKGQPVETLPGCPACVVPVGSLLLARARILDVETGKGNIVALTHVTVDRVLPAPRTNILDEILEAEGATFATVPIERPVESARQRRGRCRAMRCCRSTS